MAGFIDEARRKTETLDPLRRQPGVLSKSAPYLVGMLLLLGLYLPTSRHAVVMTSYFLCGAAALCLILTALLLRTDGPNRSMLLANAVFIPALLLLCTFFTPLDQFAYGALISYTLLALLYAANIGRIPLAPAMAKLFILVSVANVLLALLMIADNRAVDAFILANYSVYYKDLLPNMLIANKPVLTFGPHSHAAFFFYLFFFVHFRTYQKKDSLVNLALALAYLLLSFFLNCVTSYLLLLLGLGQVALHFMRRGRTAWLVVAIVSLVCAVVMSSNLSRVAVLAFSSPKNGFTARYTSTGTLAEDIRFIAAHPWSPVGLGYSRTLFFGDSGMVEYMLRGSFLLVLSIYAGLFCFLQENLVSRGVAYFLFLLYLFCDLGASNLLLLRTQYLLPFMVVYLNEAERAGPSRIRLAGGPERRPAAGRARVTAS